MLKSALLLHACAGGTPTQLPSATFCNCTLQDSRAKKCNATSIALDPCNGNIGGSSINPNQTAEPFCVRLIDSDVPTFVYNHQCASFFFDAKYGCSKSSDCANGEVCVDFGTNCVEAVCAVEATPNNCGKTFDCGLKDQCESGE